MKRISHLPLPDFKTLGHAKEKICCALKENGKMSYTDLRELKIVSKNTLLRHLKELESMELMVKTEDGKYVLRKEFLIERQRNSYNHEFLNNCYAEFYEIDELDGWDRFAAEKGKELVPKGNPDTIKRERASGIKLIFT
jgi:predicted ArsR family transcriptional regulator